MTEPTSRSNDAPSRKSLVERLQVFVGIVLATDIHSLIFFTGQGKVSAATRKALKSVA